MVILIGSSAHAIYIHALYTAACTRDMGIILKVDSHSVQFLKTDGELKAVPRHQIIFLADYPLDYFPSTRPIDLKNMTAYKVNTLINGKVQTLLVGWPMSYSEDKVAFFTVDGLETIIDRGSIFSLEKIAYSQAVRPRRTSQGALAFAHPYAFNSCPVRAFGRGKKRNIYPEQVLSDPVIIKKKLDELQMGYKGIERYYREQNFYPVPEVYPNFTSLGIWQSFGSRYGASSNRNNNLLPNLIDQYSSDLFDYQHTFISGSAPMDFASHEEPQAQITYAFKGSYFHLSAMVDPNLVLVGQNYQWKREDFESSDSRINDVNNIEFGFDFGPFATHFHVSDTVNYGIKAGDEFQSGTIPTSGLGLSYHNYRYRLYGIARSGDIEDGPATGKFSVLRLNGQLFTIPQWTLQYSLISRTVNSSGSFEYESDSITHYVQALYEFNRKYNVGGFLSMESFSQSMGGGSVASQSSSENYFKAGAYMSLKF